MEKNVRQVQASEQLKTAAEELAERAIELATRLIATDPRPAPRGGRKGRALPIVVE